MRKPSSSRPSLRPVVALWAGLGLLLAACSPVSTPAATREPPTIAPPTEAPATATSPPAGEPPAQAQPSATPPEAPAPTATAAPAASGTLRLVVAPDGNEARYVVREQLANVSLPGDAIGTTTDVTGMIVLTVDGKVVPEESRFVVDLRTLRSDADMRDNFIQRSTLETGRFPTAEFVPAEAIGLPSPLPTSGDVAFQLAGDLIVHGVTRPATWEVTAQVLGQELVGRASTSFTFGDFGMQVPRVARVLSIEDNIRLEYDFRLVLDASGSQ